MIINRIYSKTIFYKKVSIINSHSDIIYVYILKKNV
ncbi:MAG: hypothetical protein ACJA1N_001771 [Saprospiraceae bacterium]|jgi:hypothetical protein